MKAIIFVILLVAISPLVLFTFIEIRHAVSSATSTSPAKDLLSLPNSASKLNEMLPLLTGNDDADGVFSKEDLRRF